MNKYDKEYLRCKEIWEKAETTWETRFNAPRYYHYFIKGLMEQQHASILDVGCSDGIFLISLTDNVCAKQGVDPSSIAINTAKEHKPEYLNIKFESIKFEDIKKTHPWNNWNYVTIIEVLEHLESEKEIDHFLEKAMNLANKAVIFSVPIEGLIPDQDHKQMFTITKLIQLVYKHTRFAEFYTINKHFSPEYEKAFPNLFIIKMMKGVWEHEQHRD